MMIALPLAGLVAACNSNAGNQPGGSGGGITGAGWACFYPILSAWSNDYSQQTGEKVNYQSIGSGRGIAQTKAAAGEFAGAGKPLPSDELAASGLAQFPVVIGGVVPVVNLDGVAPGQLRFSGALLADI